MSAGASQPVGPPPKKAKGTDSQTATLRFMTAIGVLGQGDLTGSVASDRTFVRLLYIIMISAGGFLA